MRFLSLARVGCAVLAASLIGGVCRAATWFPLGPYGGDARSLAADPANPKHLFLGTATGWVYDSHDGGSTWTRVAQIAHRNDLVVDHIVVDNKNPKRLIVAAWTVDRPDGGLFISENYGKDWYSQAEMRGQSIRALARSSSDPSELVAGTLKGVFRSKDNGVHWTQISPEGSDEIKEVQSIAIDPSDPNVIYAGTWHLPWKTTDGGATWHNIKQGIIDDSDVFSIIVDPKQPNVVYASACSGIYKSSDAGDMFKKVQGIPSTARRTRKLAQDPEHLDTVFAGTTEGLYRTLDGGTQWDRITPADVVVNDVYVDPSNVNHVLMATDRGGVYRSEDGGSTFEASNTGFSARQVIAFAADAQNTSTLYVGVVNDKQTGGVFQSTDGAVHWQQQSEGLGGRDVFSLVSLPDGTLLAGTGHGVFRLSEGTWADSSVLDVPRPGRSSNAGQTVSARLGHPGARPRLVVASRRAGPGLRAAKSVKRQGKTSRRTRPVAYEGYGHFLRVRGYVSSGHTERRVLAGRKRALQPVRSSRPAEVRTETTSAAKEVKEARPGRLDAVVYSLTRSADVLYAGTGTGLLRSTDGGQHWSSVSSLDMPDVHFIAVLAAPKETSAAAPTVIAAGLQRMAISQDGGVTWNTVGLPSGLTQIGAVGIDGSKTLWVGGREGVWFSADNGATWKTLRNLFVTEVDSIFYDAAGQRVLVTSSVSPVAFSVQLPDQKVTYWDTGWKLRFVRPVGNHLVGATLYDGIVVQPEMVDSPAVSAAEALR